MAVSILSSGEEVFWCSLRELVPESRPPDHFHPGCLVLPRIPAECSTGQAIATTMVPKWSLWPGVWTAVERDRERWMRSIGTCRRPRLGAFLRSRYRREAGLLVLCWHPHLIIIGRLIVLRSVQQCRTNPVIIVAARISVRHQRRGGTRDQESINLVMNPTAALEAKFGAYVVQWSAVGAAQGGAEPVSRFCGNVWGIYVWAWAWPVS